MTTIVLHNLPVGCMESDIHRALLIYGTAVNIKMDTRISQAVVTMRTQQEAQALLNRHSVNVSGTSVRVDTQQSQSPQPPPSQQLPPNAMGAAGYPYAHHPPGAMHAGMAPPASVSALSQQQQSFYPPNIGGGYNSISPPPSHLLTGSGNAIMPAPPQTSGRLKVVVDDCRYPITRDVLARMFSMIAPPVAVSCGPYGPTTTGLVEFAESASAQKAVDLFHGKPIYPDCCYVKLTFAPMWEVTPPPGLGASVTPPAVDAPNAPGYPYAGQAGMPGSASLFAAPPPPPNADIDARYPGWYPRGGGGVGSGYDALYYGGYRRGDGVSLPTAAAAGRGHGVAYGDDDRREYAIGLSRGNGRGGDIPHRGLMVRGGRGAVRGAVRGGGAPPDFSPYNISPLHAHYPPSLRAAAAGESAGVGIGSRPAVAPVTDCAVLISGVAESVPLYDLWVLLEVYGNVKSLKRQHTDRTQVVAQFQHATDTVLAVQYLHGCIFRGSKLRLKRFLGYQERDTEWNLGPSTDPSTAAALFEKDYHHRVSPHMPRNPHSAMYPDKNLFLSNLTEDVTDHELEEMWRRAGFEPVASYRRGPKTSIVGFKDVETAINALIAMHLKSFESRTLYVTFSRFPPGPRLPKTEQEGARDEEKEDGADEGEGHPEKPSPALPPSITATTAEAPKPHDPVPVEKTSEVGEVAPATVVEEAKEAPKTSKHKGRSAKK
ncbi:hypothetical protein ABL78_1911 [Leptomonas seymouri]|uniref:RRM domain-containing protein n=1 Tax=Leptomonas seymouri TaxID=5684 RepID=A0A0N1I1I1_LEPSE|nr:hypothetical protein ABL78_1911 [Leptomonas seymouri]|eukprot:KPI88945.1 hypothetical protein ABL78_1911 [Leptomonas seymouri]